MHVLGETGIEARKKWSWYRKIVYLKDCRLRLVEMFEKVCHWMRRPATERGQAI